MDHAYLESTVFAPLTDALTSLSLVMAKTPSTTHPIIDPIDYIGAYLLHRQHPAVLPLSVQNALEQENSLIGKRRESYLRTHPVEPKADPFALEKGQKHEETVEPVREGNAVPRESLSVAGDAPTDGNKGNASEDPSDDKVEPNASEGDAAKEEDGAAEENPVDGAKNDAEEKAGE